MLNDVLREQAQQPRSAAHSVAGASIGHFRKTLPKDQLVQLTLVARERALWIAEHSGEEVRSNPWTERLNAILYHLYALPLPFSTAEICDLVGNPVGQPPVDRVVAYCHDRDLTPELVAALRAWSGSIRAGLGHGYNPIDVQNNLQQLDMLLWHDEGGELDLSACWSERVRRDYRAMSGERRQHWRALLRHIRGDAGSKPPKPWVRQAERSLAAVGADDFRSITSEWFRCFRDPDRLRLSVVGSHVLKGLLWYCAVVHDPAVTRAALPLLDANWKPKRNLDKVMVALALLIDTMPAEEAWQALLPLQSRWGASQGVIEWLVMRVADSLGISEQQLRALEVLKPAPPPAPDAIAPNPVMVLALATPRSAEQLIAALHILRSGG